MNNYYSHGITAIKIPKSFKLNKNCIKLKIDMSGNLDKNIFHAAYLNCDIEVTNSLKENVVNEIKSKIVEIYYKGISDIKNLTPEKLIIFNNIKEFEGDNKINTVIITTENGKDIQDIMSSINQSCNIINLDKIPELYSNDKYENFYKKITRKINRGKYDKYIIVLPNLYLDSDYMNTKKILTYIETVMNGKILFLISDLDFVEDKFLKIFGEKYKDTYIDKKKFLMKSLNLYKINILFK